VVHRSVFARTVEALEHDEQRRLPACVKEVLLRCQPCQVVRRFGSRVGLAIVTGGKVRVDLAQLGLFAGLYNEARAVVVDGSLLFPTFRLLPEEVSHLYAIATSVGVTALG
jgi:hypothetical protein